jgi:hypothetical protein
VVIPAVRHVARLARTWQGWLILIVIAAGLLIPLRYYVRHRDPHDERFAWRMFSPMRMARCTPRFLVNDQPYELRRAFHEAWVEMAERGRRRVIEAMGARVCATQPKGAVVEVWLDCTYIDKTKQTYGGYDMCTVPML